MMTTRRKRTILVAIGVLTTLCVGLIGSLGTLAVEVIKGINIVDEPSFIFENGNDKYRCYITDTNNLEISIGWGKGASETPRDLIVPDTMYNGETAYTVKGIVQGGFRSCDFETIKLPTTMNIIEEEAFAYCDKLKTFTLPYGITEIKASTFIDCRSMVHFLYYNEDGIVDTINEQITSIGSHAFNSCVRLLDFSFPTKIQTIGECAFQKCSSFTRIYLPSKIMDGSTVTNNFTIGKYAFADCTKLEFVYFEKNLTSVGSYAFVDCLNSMILHYGNETKPKTPAFSTNWRKKILDTGDNKHYSIESSYIIIRQVHKYPGLRFSIETGKDILIDCSRDNTPNRIVLDSTQAAYAAIYQWNAPADKGVRYEDYYDPESKALEIPGEVTVDNVTYPVKVINKAAFANKPDDISSVKFNSGLIQICKEAFLKDTGIENLDFSDCDTLLEISNDVFNQRNSTRNSHVEHLALPASLQYLGMYAFWAFDNVQTLSFTTNSNEPNLKVMGGACFGELGRENGGIGIEVTLPGTLDDDVAKAANINYARNGDYNDQNWAAIGPYVFGSTVNNTASTSQVTVVTMDQDPTPGLKCSLAPNAMNRARKLVKFVANKNLAMVGSEVFKNCNDLREVFLTTAGGKALADAGMLYPWGTKAEDGSTYESSILSSGGDNEKPELVLYLDGPAPGKISTDEMTDVKVKWNSETSKTYNTEFGFSSMETKTDIYYQSRSSNPTFLNVDFDFSNGSVLYWKPNTTAPNYGSFVSAPTNLDGYNAGVIALVKQKDTGNYVVARYFSSTSYVVDEINLTNLNHSEFGNISNKIVEIGDEAFAVNGASKKGYYFVLPHTVTKIDERAFFRKIDANAGTPITTSGVRIVTYKNSSGVIQPSLAEYEAARDRCNNAGSTLANIYGYCDLPSGLTDIGRFAFYSNVFQSVNVPNTVTYFGVGAFYAHDANKAKQHSRLTDITFENSHFKTINHGIYYIGSDTGKTLLYQAQNISGELTIDENTEAIGLAACTNTKYTKINLNEGLRIIYGSAFEYNYALTEVTGGEDLEYISAIAHDSNDEVYQNNTHYENIDYRDYYAGDYDIRASRKTAFKNCTSLKTFNFKNLTSLIKIGQGAFYGCNALEELTGGDIYKYYKADSNGDITLNKTLTKGVLDLSPCTNLRVIGAKAFTTKKVSYVHLPYSNGELSVARDKADDVILSGNDAEQVIFDNHNPIYLVGDVADKTYRGNDSITHVDEDKWSNKWYGNDRNKVYFHAFSASDILNGNTEGSVHYWIEHPTEENSFILCDSKAIADKYFATH